MNENEKNLEIKALKEKLEIAKEVMNQAEKMLTKLQLVMIKHKISYQKTFDEINKVNSWFKDPYEDNKIPTTEVDIEFEKMNQELKKLDEERIKNIKTIEKIIDELEKTQGENIIIEDIIKEAKQKEIDEEETNEIITKLKRAGTIFSPKHEIICKT